MCASGSLFSIRPGTLGATIQGVFMRNFILTFISHLQRVAASWRGAINSILFINAVCEARPGTRAEAGTMSSLENYKWVYLAFQRRLDVTRISRYAYKGIFIVMSSHGPAPQLNSALVQAETLCQVFFPALLKYLGWVEKWGSQAATRCSAATKKSEFQILELQILLLCICIMY